MADITPDLVTAVQAETDQWTAGLRDHVRDHYSPQTTELARKLAAAVSCQHPATAGLGRILITAARSALICRELLEEADAEPVTAEGLANLIAAAGLSLADQEETRPADPQEARAVFAASLRRERRARGWSGAELARRSGITQSTISNLESGRYGVTLHVAAQLAQALGVTIGTLADAPAGGGRG